MKHVIAVAPNQLNSIWPDIRDQVLTLETPDEMIAEDVFLHCKTGQASLFLLLVDDKRVGWMVLRQIGNAIHIWQLYADNGYDVLHQFRDELMGIARGVQGATKITYGSSRAAWQKVAPKHGFKMQIIVYECPIDAPKQLPPPDDTPPDNHPV